MTLTDATSIAPHEHAVLYPTYGYATNGGREWWIPVRGTIYDLATVGLRQRWLVQILRRLLQAPDAAFEDSLFRRRVRCFAAGAEPRRRVALRIGSSVFQLAGKTRSGVFQDVLRLSADEAQAWQAAVPDAAGSLELQLQMPAGDSRRFSCTVRLIEPSGLSVISDIDDTIKHTEVYDRRAALTNTFLREFQAVEGMVDVYRAWQQERIAFHYVSASPWQLFEALAEWMAREEFPAGSFHLRTYPIRSQILRRLFFWFRTGKRRMAVELLRRFPDRRFVLLGDTADRDPELYGSLARRFRGQVAAVFLRDVPQRQWDERRRRRAFRRLPELPVTLFQTAAELPASLRR